MSTTVDSDTRSKCAEFLYHEAEMLDERKFREWLSLVSANCSYEIPIRVTRSSGERELDFLNTGYHMKENYKTLSMRVERLYTSHAFAEDPPSRTVRMITNVRVSERKSSSEFGVKSNFSCYRAHGDRTEYDLLMGERQDIIINVDGELKLQSRRVLLAHTTLPTANLGIFL